MLGFTSVLWVTASCLGFVAEVHIKTHTVVNVALV